MQILFFGNICNYAYWFAKWARELGHDAYALIESPDLFSPQWDDPGYDPIRPPDWVIHYRPVTEREMALGGRADPGVRHLLRDFPHVHTFSNTSAIEAGAARASFVHHNVGSFGRAISWLRFQTPRSAVSPTRLALAVRFRRALARARQVIVSVPVDRYEVECSPFRSKAAPLPFPYDVRETDRALATMTRGEADGPATTFVMPARQNWELKGQDLVFRAVAGLSPNEQARCRVVLMEWGRDVDRSRETIKAMRLEDVFEWSPMLPKRDLWKLMIQPRTVVVGEFYRRSHGGGHGGVSRDAMAAGVPVISHTRPEADLLIHRSIAPIHHAECEVEDIRRQISACISTGDANLRRQGQALREWIVAESSVEAVLPRYLDLHSRAEV